MTTVGVLTFLFYAVAAGNIASCVFFIVQGRRTHRLNGVLLHLCVMAYMDRRAAEIFRAHPYIRGLRVNVQAIPDDECPD